MRKNNIFSWYTFQFSCIVTKHSVPSIAPIQSVLISTSINEQSKPAENYENALSHTNTHRLARPSCRSGKPQVTIDIPRVRPPPLSLWCSYLPTCWLKQSTIKPHPVGSIHAQLYILKAYKIQCLQGSQ